jgi:hypothetical protein
VVSNCLQLTNTATHMVICIQDALDAAERCAGASSSSYQPQHGRQEGEARREAVEGGVIH